MPQVVLRPYQTAAADKLEKILREHRVAYLRGLPRVGKSLTALSLAQRFKAGGTILVVTKKKAIASIQKDALSLLGPDHCVTVINYEQAHKYAGTSWMMVIVDEGHNVGGSYPKPSKRFKDLRQIKAALWLLMSGTPSPESYSQLYHQFALGGKPWGGYANFYKWAVDYVVVKKKFVGPGQQVNDYSGAIEAKVLRDIEPLTVTITQEDAGFETRITEHVHHVRMKPRTRRIYDRILRDGVVGGIRGRCVLADSGAKVLSKCLQLCGGTVITEAHGAMVVDRSKVEYIQNTFAASKLAILYVFDAEGKMLREAFGDLATDSPERFNADPSAVFVGQVRASREGVNLSSATDVVFMGIEHSALSWLQGRDRASYLGRTTENRIHFVFSDFGLEDKVLAVVKGKEAYTTRHFLKDKPALMGAQLELV